MINLSSNFECWEFARFSNFKLTCACGNPDSRHETSVSRVGDQTIKLSRSGVTMIRCDSAAMTVLIYYRFLSTAT